MMLSECDEEAQYPCRTNIQGRVRLEITSTLSFEQPPRTTILSLPTTPAVCPATAPGPVPVIFKGVQTWQWSWHSWVIKSSDLQLSAALYLPIKRQVMTTQRTRPPETRRYHDRAHIQASSNVSSMDSATLVAIPAPPYTNA